MFPGSVPSPVSYILCPNIPYLCSLLAPFSSPLPSYTMHAHLDTTRVVFHCSSCFHVCRIVAYKVYLVLTGQRKSGLRNCIDSRKPDQKYGNKKGATTHNNRPCTMERVFHRQSGSCALMVEEPSRVVCHQPLNSSFQPTSFSFRGRVASICIY